MKHWWYEIINHIMKKLSVGNFGAIELPIHVYTYSLIVLCIITFLKLNKKSIDCLAYIRRYSHFTFTNPYNNCCCISSIFNTYTNAFHIPLYLYSQTALWIKGIFCELLPFSAAIVTQCYQVTYCWLHLCYARDMPTEYTSNLWITQQQILIKWNTYIFTIM